MIKSLKDARIVDGLPRILAKQPWVRALSEAMGVVHEMTMAFADHSQIYTDIDHVTEDVLDALAVNWKIDWYDTGYNIEQKRRIIKTALTVRRTMGTVAAVKAQADAIYPGTTLEEWFEWGGEPGTFRLHVDISQTDEPKGNNNYGKDTTETVYKAIPSMARDGEGRIQRVATGTGPVTWSHDGTMGGIWDMNGNVWEWCTGLRLVYGEIQILQDNNAADPTADLSAGSAAWKAINAADGSLVAPDGNGTTAGTVKLNYASSKWNYSTTITGTKGAYGCGFASVTADGTIGEAAKVLLQALAMLPDTALTGTGIDTSYGGDYFYIDNNQAERCLLRGGGWFSGSCAGLFGSNLHSPRSYADGKFGGRSAFID